MPKTRRPALVSDLGYSFSKDALPKGWSYPLKRSLLDASLRKIETELVTFVNYTARRADAILWALVSFSSFYNRELISLYFYAVPGSERRSCELLLQQFALPMLENWITNWETLVKLHPDRVDRPPVSLDFFTNEGIISVHEKYQAQFQPDARYEIGRIAPRNCAPGNIV